MTLRLPRDLSTRMSGGDGPSPLDGEILAEKAASLGRAGRLVETRIGALAASPSSQRAALVAAAAEAVYAYFVQRELCGLRDHDGPIRDYAIPAEVLARLGAREGRG